LYGIENITANNGWAMAVVGASIVFTGLVALTVVISQIHRLLELWEKREKYLQRFKKQPPIQDEEKAEAPADKEHQVPSVDELASTYGPLVEQLEEPFELSQLFRIAKNKDLPHPHLSIKQLRESEILIASEDGTFTWKKP
jgi:hypothetical protein